MHIESDEVDGPPVDYTKDYRRFAYKDFALGELQSGNNISPDALLRYADTVHNTICVILSIICVH